MRIKYPRPLGRRLGPEVSLWPQQETTTTRRIDNDSETAAVGVDVERGDCVGQSCRGGQAGNPEPRGAVVETDRYRAEICNGVLTRLHNKLTNEEYLNRVASLAAILPHLPSGLGTQNTTVEREAAQELFQWPWWEQPHTSQWPNQHYPTAASAFSYDAKNDSAAVLTYRGLTGAGQTFADETFTLQIAVDPQTGDLLVTPAAESPRGGVYGCGLTLAALGPEITVESADF